MRYLFLVVGGTSYTYGGVRVLVNELTQRSFDLHETILRYGRQCMDTKKIREDFGGSGKEIFFFIVLFGLSLGRLLRHSRGFSPTRLLPS